MLLKGDECCQLCFCGHPSTEQQKTLPTPAAIHCIPFHPSLLMSIASTLPPSIVINNGQNETNRPQVKWG
jgi:hypothetical protein